MYYTLIYLKYNTDLAFLSPPYAVMLNKEDVRKIKKSLNNCGARHWTQYPDFHPKKS